MDLEQIEDKFIKLFESLNLEYEIAKFYDTNRDKMSKKDFYTATQNALDTLCFRVINKKER